MRRSHFAGVNGKLENPTITGHWLLIQVSNLFQPSNSCQGENLSVLDLLVATIKRRLMTMQDLLRRQVLLLLGNDFRTWCETKLHLQSFLYFGKNTFTEVLDELEERMENIKIEKTGITCYMGSFGISPRFLEIILDNTDRKPNLSICIYWEINLNPCCCGSQSQRCQDQWQYWTIIVADVLPWENNAKRHWKRDGCLARKRKIGIVNVLRKYIKRI